MILRSAISPMPTQKSRSSFNIYYLHYEIKQKENKLYPCCPIVVIVHNNVVLFFVRASFVEYVHIRNLNESGINLPLIKILPKSKPPNQIFLSLPSVQG